MFRHLIVVAVVFWVSVAAGAEDPTHDAFTYQGQLRHNGEAVSGPIDLKFRLYDSAEDQVGPELVLNGFDSFDDDGRFTIDLAFGKGVFDGTQLWLEIEVDGVTLSPRQPIMPTPYAVRALNVATVADGALAGTYSGELILTNEDNKFAGRFDGNGENLFNLSASNIATGTLGSTLLSGSYTNALTFNNAGNQFTGAFAGSGAGLTGLNASNITSGTLADARLSSNIPLRDASNIFSQNNIFQANVGVGVVPSARLHVRQPLANNVAIIGQASATDGFTIGVQGDVSSPNGYAGYFTGPENSRNYFQRRVGIGTLNPRGQLNVSLNSGVTNSSPIEQYPILISYPSNADGQETGLAFRIASQQSNGQTPGAAITHRRSFASSGGTLLFKTRTGGEFSPLHERMRISSDGRIGIGTDAPIHRLHVETDSGRAVYGVVTGESGLQSYGGYFEANSDLAYGVLARTNANSTQGTAIYAHAASPTGNTHGVLAQNKSTSGKAIVGWATADSGTTYGVIGHVSSPDGYAGYFVGGRSYFAGNVGVGMASPAARLHVARASSGSVPQMLVENTSSSGFARLRLTNEAHTPYWDIAAGGTNNYLDFFQSDGGGSILTLRGDTQNAGVRTTNPAFTLHVNGSAGKPGGGSWSAASDERLKHNIQPLTHALEQLLALESVTYEYIDPDSIHELPGQRIGMIAQQVAEVFPDWVNEAEDGYLRLTYRGFEAIIVEAIRELREEKDVAIAQLQQENDELRDRMARLERAMLEMQRQGQGSL